MRIYISLILTAIISSVAVSGSSIPLPSLPGIGKAYPLRQALQENMQQVFNYSVSSGEILKDIKEFLKYDIGKRDLNNLTRNIDNHIRASSFVSVDTLAKIGEHTDGTLLHNQFNQLHSVLKAEIAAEGLLKAVARRLLDEGKHDLLFDKLLLDNAIADKQLHEVLLEVLPDTTEKEAEELFIAAQNVVNKRNVAAKKALADQKNKKFYAYMVKEESGGLHMVEDGNFNSGESFDDRNIIVFGETINGVEKRIKEQTSKSTNTVTVQELPSGREQLDKIVMKILALTSDFRRVEITRTNGIKNIEAFVIVDDSGNIKNLADEQAFVKEEVEKAISIVERSYFYRSLFSEQKLISHLKLSYEGADLLEFKKPSIISTLAGAAKDGNLDKVLYDYDEQLNNRDVRKQLAELYRAIETLRDQWDGIVKQSEEVEEVMNKIDKKFNELLTKEYKISSDAREITPAEIERQAAVLDLQDVTGSEFKKAPFGGFIAGGGIPETVRNFFDDETSLNDEQQAVWKRLRRYSFVQKDIIATLEEAAENGNLKEVLSGYGEQLHGNARQQLTEFYHAKEALRDKWYYTTIDEKFKEFLTKEYKISNNEKARKITPAEIERKAAVLDLHDVTESKFKKVSFDGFIAGRNGVPKKVRDFFSTTELNEAQQAVWAKLQRLEKLRLEKQWLAADRFAKENIIATLVDAAKGGYLDEVLSGYGEQLNKNARQQLAEFYRAKEALRDQSYYTTIDEKFKEFLTKEYKISNNEKAREITLDEIERQAAVLDLQDVTGSEFEEVRFDGFIAGRNGVPKEVRKFFSKPNRTDAQKAVWAKLQRLTGG